MPRKRQKRGWEGGDGGRDGDDDREEGSVPGSGGGSPPQPAASSSAQALKRLYRLPSDLGIRGCSCSCSHHQGQGLPTGCACVQAVKTRINAAISRFMEEVAQVLTSPWNLSPNPQERIEQNLPPTYKLTFVNSMSDKIFTKREVRAAGGGHLMIKLAVSNQQGSNIPQLLSANVKVLVLDGDFNADNRECWTSEEFEHHIMIPRDKIGAVLTGKLKLKLKNGEAYLENIIFVDNSKFTRSGKFRLGVMLIDNHGERVQEAITEPFTVKDRRGEGYKKCDIPTLDDEVWRLDKIAKKGPFCKSLEQRGITLVKHFLRLYYMDEKTLRNKKMVNHAKKCDPGTALYSHFMEDKKIRLYFTCVGQIVGATIADQYHVYDDLDTIWKDQVKKWSKDAYECMDYHQHDYEMYNRQPRAINSTTLQGSIMSPTKPTGQIIHETDEQDTSEVNRVFGVCSQQFPLQRIGSRRVRALPCAQENNETGASFGIAGQLDSDDEIQHETSDLNCITDYPVCCTEQGGPSQCPFPPSLTVPADCPGFSLQHSFSESDLHEIMKMLEPDEPHEELLINKISQFSTANLSDMPADVRCFMVKLLSFPRWIKLAAPVKWMAIMSSSKKIRAAKGKAHA
ncbi:unnamed protein product [Miscanthus lutarioriparius]|uniref:Calmodulin-binding protein n=1 Tax=Miscanthus lutarioriparius TaxID=422564 RepID=A0A811RC65_9POAL|nr:unnamed protein product [Miscanthus lutarioriparius]